MPVLAAIMWFAHPAPLDMPRAEAYLVTEGNGTMRLEDRYDELDLWTANAVLGRWTDDDGRILELSKLAYAPPRFDDVSSTRARYVADLVRIERDNEYVRDEAISMLSPVDMPEDEAKSPRQMPRGFRSVLYYQGTNESAVVCAFLPEKSKVWYLATWTLAEGDLIRERLVDFEEDFLGRWDEIMEKVLVSERGEGEDGGARRVRREGRSRSRRDKRETAVARERELLRADVRHSVTNYPNWHVTEAEEFSVIDDLPPAESIMSTLTNELAVMRRRYSEVVPSPIDGSNVLAVARVFKSRDEYLDALEVNDVEGIDWSGAYWSSQRRELVAYMPPGGGMELLKTIRHEAFHQYLSYATSMISASPWLNEGYAQYFEDEDNADWGVEVDLDAVADMLLAVMAMDYQAFYDGTSEARRLKYKIAWSIAYFLEKGAPNVRFAPFKDVKKNYIESLLRHRDMFRATAEAFGNRDTMEKFVAEWKKYWKDM